MTEHPLADWNTAFDRYRTTSGTLLAEMDRADEIGEDIDDDIGRDHRNAGLGVIYAPASNVVQVAQKIRVADNLFQLTQVHPDLAQILLDDLLSIAGLASGDQPPLPPKV
jgi:hypothetical protein